MFLLRETPIIFIIITILIYKTSQISIEKEIAMENPNKLFIDGQYINPFSDKIKIIGRTNKHIEKNLTIFDWPGTSINLEVIGTCDEIYLDLKSKGDYFSVYYNEEYQYKTEIHENYLLKIIPKIENVKIKLLKRTEPLMTGDYVRFKGIYLVGKCDLKINPKEKYGLVEFIGDSITCGFGVEQLRNKTASLDSSNIDMAFPGILARRLNVEYYAICASGMGITHSSGYNGVGRSTEYYNRDYFYNGKFIPSITTKPDVVIICLGTNDWIYIKSNFYTDKMINAFIETYKIFLLQIRYLNSVKNGILPPIIVLGIGPKTAAATANNLEMEEISNKMNPWIEKAVNLTGGANSEIYFKEISANPLIDFDNDDDFGSGDHWSVRGSEKFANGLYSTIYNFTNTIQDVPALENNEKKFLMPNIFGIILFLLVLIN